MSASKLPTKYASAERSPVSDLINQSKAVSKIMLLNNMVNSIPFIVMILNENRQIVFANDTLVKFLNMSVPNDYLGKRPGELVGCIHASELSGGCGTTEFCRKCGAVNAILNSQKGIPDTQECRIETSGYNNLDLRVNAYPTAIEGKVFTVFTIQDISDEKRRLMLERIFFHDLLNTAGGIKGFTDLIRESPEPDAELLNVLSVLSERLIEEIQAQRDLLAAEQGTLNINYHPIMAHRMLNDLVELYSRHPVSEGKILKILPVSQNILFISDERLVRRIIGNMIKNALEAIEPGQEVSVNVSPRKGFTVFMIHNPGFMPREIQLQIFHRSYSTKSIDRGLGTYSMKLLSEKYLKARVGFTSTKKYGTTFYAIFPTNNLMN